MVNNNNHYHHNYGFGGGGRGRGHNHQDRTNVGPRGPIHARGGRRYFSNEWRASAYFPTRASEAIPCGPARRFSSPANLSHAVQASASATQPPSNTAPPQATSARRESHQSDTARESEQSFGDATSNRVSGASQPVDEPNAPDTNLSPKSASRNIKTINEGRRLYGTTNLEDGIEQLILRCRRQWGSSITVKFDLSIAPGEPFVQCGNCREFGHRVIECRNSCDGVIKGCGCCNSPEHSTEKCKDFPRNARPQVELLVKRRGHMAPLASPDWYPILYEAVVYSVTHAHEGPLPWTKQFSLSIEQQHGSGDRCADPDTRDWPKTKATYRGIPPSLHAARKFEARFRSENRPKISGLRPSRICRLPINLGDEKLLEESEAMLKQAYDTLFGPEEAVPE